MCAFKTQEVFPCTVRNENLIKIKKKKNTEAKQVNIEM